MGILPRLTRVLLVSSLSLLVVLLSLRVLVPVRADVGVQPILPGGSSIKPDLATPVQMAAERVVMTVRSATEADNAVVILNPEAYGYQVQPVWFSAIAEVEVDFTMKNPTGEAVSMTGWFPLACALETSGWEEISPEETVPRIQSFRVSVDGIPVDYAVNELPNPNGADKPDLPWASFQLAFPAGKDTMIHVSYVLPLHSRGNALVLYYIFQTGAGWAGPIGQAELIINLPYPASSETLARMPSGSLNPPYFVFSGDGVAGLPQGGVLEGNLARWTWKNLEPGPSDDFSILLIDLGKWDELQAARAAVNATPDDGRAWLKLCTTYRSLGSSGAGQRPMAWGEIYQPMGLQSCLEAARLQPDDIAPHYQLALLYASALPQHPSPAALQPVWDELKIMHELDPAEAQLLEPDVYELLEPLLDIAATQTAAQTSLPAPSATALAQVTLTPQPLSSPPPTPTEAAGGALGTFLGVAIIVIGLLIAAYLVLSRTRSSAIK